MKARLPKGYGRPDPNAMMRQVQKMPDDIRARRSSKPRSTPAPPAVRWSLSR